VERRVIPAEDRMGEKERWIRRDDASLLTGEISKKRESGGKNSKGK
jgi:hypothetical protein